MLKGWIQIHQILKLVERLFISFSFDIVYKETSDVHLLGRNQ